MPEHDLRPNPAGIDPQPLLDAIDDPCFVVDASGVLRGMNEAFARRIEADEGIPLPVEAGRLALPDALDPASDAGGEEIAAICAVLRGAAPRRTLKLSGAGGPWELHATACAVDGARGALIRLTRERGAELKLAAEAMDAMPLAVIIYRLEDLNDDRTLRVEYANRASEVITGQPVAYCLGKTLEEQLPSARSGGLLGKYVEVVRTGQRLAMEMVVPDPARQREVGIALHAYPLPGQRVAVLFEDVSERLRTAASLTRTTAFLDSIIENIPSIIFIKEAEELRYVRVNRAFESLFGASREQIVGKSDHDLFPEADARHAIGRDREVFTRGAVLDFQETVVIRGRGARTFHTRKVPLFDEDKRPQYLLGITDDITERIAADEAKRNEAVLLETQKTLMEVIRELSTPVIPVHDGILVVPLIGQMDAARSSQFLEALLSGIVRHRAASVLIDITGVSVVDSSVAGNLLQATRAAALLGTECHLVGVTPAVARTIVALGIDLGQLSTHGDLQAGFRHALAQQGKRIVARRREAGRAQLR